MFQIGSLDLSWVDLALVAAIAIVVIWAALKLVTRLILGVILVVVLAALFFGFNFSELGINFG